MEKDYYNEELLSRLHPAVREYLDVIVKKEKPLAVYLVGEDTDEFEQNWDEYPHGVELVIVEGKGDPTLLDDQIKISEKHQYYLNTGVESFEGFDEYRENPWTVQLDLLYARPIWLMKEFMREKKAYVGVPPLDSATWFQYASRWMAYYEVAFKDEWYDHAANFLGINVEFLLKAIHLKQSRGSNENIFKKLGHSLKDISSKMILPNHIKDSVIILSNIESDKPHIKYPGGRDFTREDVLRLKAARDRIYEYVRTFFPDVQEDYRPGTAEISGPLDDASDEFGGYSVDQSEKRDSSPDIFA